MKMLDRARGFAEPLLERAQLDTVKKVTDAAALDEALSKVGTELEMLISIVSGLKIEPSS